MIDKLPWPIAYFRHRSSVWRNILLTGCMLFNLIAAQAIAAETAAPHKGVRDFAAYWASTQLLLSGHNPYSPVELLELQRKLGWQDDAPLMMWNPPWTFAITLPFGLLDFATGQFLWLLLHVLLLLNSSRLLWNLYGEPADRHRWAWLLTVTFVPAIFVLVIGQIAPLVLIGLTGFLCLERQGKGNAAGAALVLVLMKPHFVYLFWPVLLLWILQRNERVIVWGAGCAGLLAAALPLIFDPLVYHQYIGLFRPTELALPLDLPAPTLRNVAKLLLQLELGVWQMLPSLLAAAWVVFYWWRHRTDWQWSERLPLILLVSLTTSTYSWTFDQVVFLPALIHGASWLVRQQLPWYRSIAALLYIVINLAHAVLRIFVAEELWYFWLAPALLIAYLVFLREAAGQRLARA